MILVEKTRGGNFPTWVYCSPRWLQVMQLGKPYSGTVTTGKGKERRLVCDDARICCKVKFVSKKTNQQFLGLLFQERKTGSWYVTRFR